MASRTVCQGRGEFKTLSNLTKPKLKQICNILSIDFEKSIRKRALVNNVSSALKISTSRPSSNDSQGSSISYTDVPFASRPREVKRLAEESRWRPSGDGGIRSERALIGAGYNQQAWEHKKGIHSVK